MCDPMESKELGGVSSVHLHNYKSFGGAAFNENSLVSAVNRNKFEPDFSPSDYDSDDVKPTFDLDLSNIKVKLELGAAPVESVQGYTQTTPPLVNHHQLTNQTLLQLKYPVADDTKPFTDQLIIDTNSNTIRSVDYSDIDNNRNANESLSYSVGGGLNDVILNRGDLNVDSPLSVRCTTQATIALLTKPQPDNVNPYNTDYTHQQQQQQNVATSESRFFIPNYVDRSQVAYAPQRYHPYSGSATHLYNNNTNYQPQFYSQNYSDYCYPNPQFPPQNFIDIPDISHSNSVYNPYPRNNNNNFNNRYQHLMSERAAIMNTMDDVTAAANGNQLSYGEPMVLQGAGLNPLALDNGVDDGLMQGSLTNSNISRKKRNGSPGRDDNSKPKKAKSPKKRKKRDPNEPQKPVSAYAMFFRDTQASIKSSNPSATFGEVSKIVASMWDSLEDASKTEYKSRTDIAKKEYLQKLAAYRATLVSTGALDPTITSNSSASDSSSRESPERTGNQSDTVIHIVAASQRPLQVDVQPTIMSYNFEDNVAAVPAQDRLNYTQLQPPMTSVRVQQQVITAPPSVHQHMTTTSQDNQVMTPAQNEVTEADVAKVDNDHQNSVPSNVFYGKIPSVGKSPSQNVNMVDARQCVRDGCVQRSVGSPQWDNEYCSNQCVVDHCRDAFTAWVASRSGFTPVN